MQVEKVFLRPEPRAVAAAGKGPARCRRRTDQRTNQSEQFNFGAFRLGCALAGTCLLAGPPVVVRSAVFNFIQAIGGDSRLKVRSNLFVDTLGRLCCRRMWSSSSRRVQAAAQRPLKQRPSWHTDQIGQRIEAIASRGRPSDHRIRSGGPQGESETSAGHTEPIRPDDLHGRSSTAKLNRLLLAVSRPDNANRRSL